MENLGWKQNDELFENGTGALTVKLLKVDVCLFADIPSVQVLE